MRFGPLTRVFVLVGAASAANVGCVARVGFVGQAEPPPPPPPEPAPPPDPPPPVVFESAPVLVTIEPGIWVVQDADYPVYRVDDYYWVYRENVWYRSRSYDGGWARAEVTIVPPTIAHRDHAQYVHYRGAANAQRRPAPTEHPRSAYEHGPNEHVAPSGRVVPNEHVAPNEHAAPNERTAPNERVTPNERAAPVEPARREGVQDARVRPGATQGAAVEGARTATPTPEDDRGARERAANAHPAPVAAHPNPSVEGRRVAPAPTPKKRENEKR